MAARSGNANPIGLGLLGAGNVGGGVLASLAARARSYEQRIGRPLKVRRALVRDAAKARPGGLDPAVFTVDAADVLDGRDIQIIVELMGGEHPAYDYVRRALVAGKHVVTANKEVMAKHGPELLALAQENNVALMYEASVGGGIPIIAPLKRDLLANELIGVRAIINGTTNYILTRMSREGADFAPVLRDAQQLGYAEPDPTSDVEGIDAAFKLSILASLAFRTWVHPDRVYREGITKLTARDFRYAHELGYVIKLLALARRTNDQLELRVHPALLPAAEPLAKVDGVFNAVQLEGDLLGSVMLQGQGAGAMPTASAVVADVIDVARRVALGSAEAPAWLPEQTLDVRAMGDVRTRFYIRVEVADQAGVLAKITSVLGERFNISIASVIQKETNEEAQTAELVIMTHETDEAALQCAMVEVGQLPVVARIGSVIRVEDQGRW